MKQMSKLIILFVLLTIFTSCNKGNYYSFTPNSSPTAPPSLPPPVIISDSLTGKEFIFENLTWIKAYDEGMETYQCFVSTPSRPDLFKTSRRMEVSFKFDTATHGDYVQDYYTFSQSGLYYWYYINQISKSLRILSSYPIPDFAGQKASIRIKFL